MRKNISIPDYYDITFCEIRKLLFSNHIKSDYNTSDSEIIRLSLEFYVNALAEGKVEVTAHGFSK